MKHTKPYRKRLKSFYFFVTSLADERGETGLDGVQLASRSGITYSSVANYLRKLEEQKKIIRTSARGTICIPKKQSDIHREIEQDLFSKVAQQAGGLEPPLPDKPLIHQLDRQAEYDVLKREIEADLSVTLIHKIVDSQEDMEKFLMRMLEKRMERERIWKTSVFLLWAFILAVFALSIIIKP